MLLLGEAPLQSADSAQFIRRAAFAFGFRLQLDSNRLLVFVPFVAGRVFICHVDYKSCAVPQAFDDTVAYTEAFRPVRSLNLAGALFAARTGWA